MTSALPNSRSNTSKRELAKLDGLVDTTVVRNLMSYGDGRRWMWRLLGTCGIFQASPVDSHARMAHAEGKREIGLILLASINRTCPREYITMTEEATRVDLTFNKEEDDAQEDE